MQNAHEQVNALPTASPPSPMQAASVGTRAARHRTFGAATLLLIASAMIIVVGCGANRLPTGAEIGGSPEDVAQLDHGRATYADRCGVCHRLYAPSTRTVEKWPDTVAWMAKRAKIDASQQAEITRYLVAARSAPPAP